MQSNTNNNNRQRNSTDHGQTLPVTRKLNTSNSSVSHCPNVTENRGWSSNFSQDIPSVGTTSYPSVTNNKSSSSLWGTSNIPKNTMSWGNNSTHLVSNKSNASATSSSATSH